MNEKTIKVEWETFVKFSLRYFDLSCGVKYLTEEGKKKFQELFETFVAYEQRNNRISM